MDFTSRSYEDAVRALNSLVHLKPDDPAPDAKINWSANFDNIFRHIQVLDLKDSLSRLSVIHVAGTKGKGSTCAFAESMLRASGFRTGLFTSPHLFHVRERFRFNGTEVSKECFTENFWFCWDRLKEASEELPMPGFFRFATLLALRMFLRENVDVAILEVGLGGRLDATNVIPAPAVCGISSLGFDHMELLGNTLTEIAGEKAGIFKAGVPAITAPQLEEAMKALQRKAEELKIPLEVAPPLNSYGLDKIQLGLRGEHQLINASLAVALCKRWAYRTGHQDHWKLATEKGCLPDSYLEGLASTCWPGRAEIVQDVSVHGGKETLVHDNGSVRPGGLHFYLDGAHSPESTEACGIWFCSELEKFRSFFAQSHDGLDTGHSSEAQKSGQSISETDVDSTFRRVLLFNCMPRRDPQSLLPPLVNVCFRKGLPLDVAFFVPPTSKYDSVDAISIANSKGQVDVSRQVIMQRKWETLWKPHAKEPVLGSSAVPSTKFYNRKELLSGLEVDSQGLCQALEPSSAVMSSLAGTLDWIRLCSKRHPQLHIQVLVTGSLYLVGDMLKLLKH